MENYKLKDLIYLKERSEVIRQDRFKDDSNYMSVSILGKKYLVNDYSKFGIGIIAEKSVGFKENQKIENVKIWVNESCLYTNGATLVHIKPHGDKYIFGLDLEFYLDINEVQAIIDINKIIESTDNLNKERNKLDKDFLNTIDSFHYYIKTTKEKIDVIEKKVNSLDTDLREKYLESFKSTFNLKFQGFFKKIHKSLNQLKENSDVSQDSFYLKYAQDLITPFFTEIGLGKRAVEKPLGYAGDYEMMNQIYKKDINQGSLFGNLMHFALIESKTSESVRFRRNLLANLFKDKKEENLKSKEIRSLSVASGPAQEVLDFIVNSKKEEVERFKFDLLDLDKFSLRYAQARITEAMKRSGKKTSLKLINENVIHMALGKTERIPKESYDLIYSAGLYDYLDFTISKLLTQTLFEALKPGGTLLIGNFSSKNPEKIFLDLVLDWFLIHKSDNEMVEIVPKGASFELSHDDNNVIAYLKIKKNK